MTDLNALLARKEELEYELSQVNSAIQRFKLSRSATIAKNPRRHNGLSSRAYHGLKNLGFHPENPSDAANIAALGRRALFGPNLGKVTVYEIETWLNEKGHQLSP
jgi:hypothetical protein